MDEKTMIKADFVSSIVIILFSALVLFFSFRMPPYEEWGLYATPSIAPIAFATLLLFCGLILLVRSIAKKGYRISIKKEHFARIYRSRGVTHFVVVLGLVIIYYLLLGKVHFILISGAYIFFNILYFQSTAVWKNVLISGITAATVWHLFNNLLVIPLP